jgi:hypothetical protein
MLILIAVVVYIAICRSDAVELTKAALPQTSIFIIDLGKSQQFLYGIHKLVSMFAWTE